MAKLVMNPHSASRRDIALGRTLLSIGRDPSNDLVLPDAMVSRRHAVIECRGNQYYLRDCNSSNGSLVNGDRVSERSLRDGDLVAIGAARLLFREELELLEPGGKVVQHPSAARLQCPACQADYRKGDAFCRQCGGRLQEAPAKVVCAACGTAVALPARFCNACGQRLGPDEPAKPAPEAPPPPPSTDKREREPDLQVVSADEVEAGAGEAAPPQPRGDGAPAEPESARAASPAESASAPVPAEPARSPARAALAPRPAPERADPERANRDRVRPRLAPTASAERPRLVPFAGARPAEPHPTGPAPLVVATAGVGERLAAAVVDAFAVAALQALVLLPLVLWRPTTALGGDRPMAWYGLAAGLGLVALLAGAGYYVFFWARGKTPGKRLLGLELQALEAAGPIGPARAGLRLLGCALSLGALGLPFLPIFTGGQALHDRLARTRVARSARH